MNRIFVNIFIKFPIKSPSYYEKFRTASLYVYLLFVDPNLEIDKLKLCSLRYKNSLETKFKRSKRLKCFEFAPLK